MIDFFIAVKEIFLRILEWVINVVSALITILSDGAENLSNLVVLTADGMRGMRTVIMYLPSPLFSVIAACVLVMLIIALVKVAS